MKLKRLNKRMDDLSKQLALPDDDPSNLLVAELVQKYTSKGLRYPYIVVIRDVKERLGVGLADAKVIVDAYFARHGISRPRLSPTGRFFNALAVVFVVALMVFAIRG